MDAAEVTTHICGTLQSFLHDHPVLEDLDVKVQEPYVDLAGRDTTIYVTINGEKFALRVRKI